jgi:hypothetical protein
MRHYFTKSVLLEEREVVNVLKQKAYPLALKSDPWVSKTGR